MPSPPPPPQPSAKGRTKVLPRRCLGLWGRGGALGCPHFGGGFGVPPSVGRFWGSPDNGAVWGSSYKGVLCAPPPQIGAASGSLLHWADVGGPQIRGGFGVPHSFQTPSIMGWFWGSPPPSSWVRFGVPQGRGGEFAPPPPSIMQWFWGPPHLALLHSGAPPRMWGGSLPAPQLMGSSLMRWFPLPPPLGSVSGHSPPPTDQ